MEQGLVQVYTGNGKGKTTAAVGLAVRALGQGLRVLLVRFFKPAEPISGEVAFLQGAPNLTILTSGLGIFGPHPDREAVAASVAATFAEARKVAESGRFDIIILDEANNAVHRGCLSLDELLAFVDGRPAGTEVVVTGRRAAPELLERADLVTVMEPAKHPLAQGIPARRGIEY